MTDQLPVLVAAVADERARELEEASRVGRHVWVELRWPPAESGPHLLEVYTPTDREPLRLLAEPLGTSSERGFALRIYPWEEAEGEAAPEHDVEVPADHFIGRALAGGRFEIVSTVGEGSIGAVYRARHTGLGIVVAVKVLHQAFQRDIAFCRRFYDEALALSRLDHPNLVHIYDFGQEPDGLLYISMAYVDGQTLRAVCARERKPFTTKRMVSVMLQVCAGLGHAHARGLLHRDVKPDNVMIVAREDDDGVSVENVKLLDFGFAVPPSASADVAQRLAGTPVYMSPEQCLGEELDARSDVYACGVMIYELMTGKVPYMGRSADEIRAMHVEAPVPRIPGIDPRVDRLVQKAMAKSREDRHQDMKELRADLKLLLLADGESRPSGRVSLASIPSPQSFDLATGWDASGREVGSGRDVAPSSRELPANAAKKTADSLAHDAGSWLGSLANERDPREFTRKFAELDAAVRVLAQRSDAKTLRKIAIVVTMLEEKLDRLTRSDEGAGDAIAKVARLFKDPEILTPVAARLLVRDADGQQAATELVARAGVAGAYALYGARTRLVPAEAAARVGFVTAMKALRESALPVVSAGLERVYEPAIRGETRVSVELAEDLLLGIPQAPDEATGHLVVKYAASSVPQLCRGAARALPRVWGVRAAPILLGLVGHDEDGVRVAAIVGLREVGAVDAQAVTRIASLFESARAPSAQLRAAAIAALKDASATDLAARVMDRLRAQSLV
jgi:eukaryotic-like serine/threonine-protein kinase